MCEWWATGLELSICGLRKLADCQSAIQQTNCLRYGQRWVTAEQLPNAGEEALGFLLVGAIRFAELLGEFFIFHGDEHDEEDQGRGG